jgi:sensor histidine kinase regulating citrate/malate metabolism
MPQESLSLESSKLAKPFALPWQIAGLRWKIATAFSGIIIIQGLAVIGIVYYLTSDALRKQVDYRAVAIATNLSDASAGHMARRNTLELDALIAKYGRLDGVAYAYIRDAKGEIAASSLQPFPSELKEHAPTNGRRTISSRVLTLRGRSAYETQVPILEGQFGAVHVALWADAVQQDVRKALIPIIGLIGLCLIFGLGVSVIIAGKAVRPILELTETAEEISRGHLDRVVTVQATGEVGELARSLERMRASLKAAMVRLSKN